MLHVMQKQRIGKEENREVEAEERDYDRQAQQDPFHESTNRDFDSTSRTSSETTEFYDANCEGLRCLLLDATKKLAIPPEEEPTDSPDVPR